MSQVNVVEPEEALVGERTRGAVGRKAKRKRRLGKKRGERGIMRKKKLD